MKMFDGDKTRMIGLPYGEKNYYDILSRFHLVYWNITDGRTDRFAISISRVSMLMRDNKESRLTSINLCYISHDIVDFLVHKIY